MEEPRISIPIFILFSNLQQSLGFVDFGVEPHKLVKIVTSKLGDATKFVNNSGIVVNVVQFENSDTASFTSITFFANYYSSEASQQGTKEM